MTAPELQVAAGATEEQELEGLGIVVAQPATPADVDAWASLILRQMGEVDRDIKRYQEAYQAEMRHIGIRYDLQLQRLIGRRGVLEHAVHGLATRADFGSKKSRDVGFGTYGVRSEPERIRIVDATAATEWARTHAPELIEIETKEKLPQKAVAAYVKSTGDAEIPGVVREPAHETPFAKPSLPETPQ
jgi:phage host-nuclease inhibitor protein Gam